MNAQQIKGLVKQAEPGRHAIGNGLYFRISKEGTGFWAVRYTILNKRREITIGRYPDLSLADAKAETTLIKKNVKRQIDPLAERKREKSTTLKTVNDLAEDWLKDCEKRLQHPNIPRRIYEKDISPTIGELGISQVTPMDVRTAIKKITKSDRPTIANDALMYCKQLFKHGVKLNLLTYNPAEAFTVSDAGGVEKSRSRTLSLDEIGKVFATFRKYGDQFVRENYLAAALLLVLGVRKGELIAAEWAEFDLQEALWYLPKERSKTGSDIAIPLPRETVEWLQELKVRAFNSEYVFPNRRASKRNGHMSLDTLNAAFQKLFREKKMPVEHFTIHDLRRTCRSLLAEMGVPGHIAERCLNHKLKGVEGIYDRYDYLEERKQALQGLSLKVALLVNQ